LEGDLDLAVDHQDRRGPLAPGDHLEGLVGALDQRPLGQRVGTERRFPGASNGEGDLIWVLSLRSRSERGSDWLCAAALAAGLWGMSRAVRAMGGDSGG
jgi:hypothetical protein